MKGVVIEAARYDKDGIQICFLNDRAKKDVKVRPCYRELSR